ncbi:MAG TPA: bifunctional UDP-4-keto-pentose/UDP-xylose synthase [Elusimicrobiales bacterium]|nr:bifunctional UDP-4-keto-pentose/UDP-xylose synthase [Elusimicrobiales bacterium]
MKVLILGVNGFIGHHLTERILRETDWHVYGMDLASDRIQPLLANPRFHFSEGDISVNHEWIEFHVKKCDAILPLVAIATPKLYVQDPIRVFELDFEQNLKVVRYCVRHKKWLIFPSTSEIYGMCTDEEFNEDTSNIVLGPIRNQRWIYSVSKQLLDRVIWGYGQKEGLKFTTFRPFNWIGPGLDSINAAKEGSSRVLTQFLWNILSGKPLHIVNGGEQRRCFTYISDGVDGLMRILSHKGNDHIGEIFNFGNPQADKSVRELAETLIKVYNSHPKKPKNLPEPKLVDVSEEAYYGKDYQDMARRKPAIAKAKRILGWEPKIGFDEAIAKTVDFYLDLYAKTPAIELENETV